MDKLNNSPLSTAETVRAVITLCKEEGMTENARFLEGKLKQIQDGRTNIYVVGRSNSGKSTLINSLLENPILPVKVTPCTVLPVEVIYGDKFQLSVGEPGKEKTLPVEHLVDFVDESKNPGNIREISSLKVSIPNKILARGSLFDTPGFASVYSIHDRILINNIGSADVILFVYRPPALQPGTEDQELLLRFLQKTPNLILVQNEDANTEDGERILNAVKTNFKKINIHPMNQFRVNAKLKRDAGTAMLRTALEEIFAGQGTYLAANAVTASAREAAAELLTRMLVKHSLIMEGNDAYKKKRMQLQTAMEQIREIGIRLRNDKAAYVGNVEIQILGHLTLMKIYLNRSLSDLLSNECSLEALRRELLPRTNSALNTWYKDLENLVRTETEGFQRRLVEADEQAAKIVRSFLDASPQPALKHVLDYKKRQVEFNIAEVIKPDISDRIIKTLLSFADKAAKPIALAVMYILNYFGVTIPPELSASALQAVVKALSNLGTTFIDRQSKILERINDAWSTDLEAVSASLKPQLAEVPVMLAAQAEQWINDCIEHRIQLLNGIIDEVEHATDTARGNPRNAELSSRIMQAGELIASL